MFGISLGIPLSKAVAGPFAQFQNCEANQDSITTVVLKLIQRNPSARPREQAVRRQVNAFLEDVDALLKKRSAKTEAESQEEINASAVAKLFEEVKIMFRDLPGRVESLGTKREPRQYQPIVIEELLMAHRRSPSNSIHWLLVGSYLKDSYPWMAEPVLEIYRAMESGDSSRTARALDVFRHVITFTSRSRFHRHFMGSDREGFTIMQMMSEMIDYPIDRPDAPKAKSEVFSADLKSDDRK